MKINHFLSAIFLICSFAANAAGSLGAVYTINNVGKTNISMTASASGAKAVGVATNDADLKQQWYISGDDNAGYYIRNVATGAYLSSPNATSQQWTLEIVSKPVDATMLMSITDLNGDKVIHAKKDNFRYGYAHADASNNIVCWATDNVNTHWQLNDLNKSDEEIEAILARFHSTADEIARAADYESHLAELFNDKACTDLKKGLDLASNEHYNSLPPALQAMAAKMQPGGSWSETYSFGDNTYEWDSDHVEKYRVQLYEPYSEGSNAASMAGIQAYTNMNNPTGILGDEGDLLYVMVEDEPLPGSTLYISGFADTGMHNSVTDGVKLHRGLNIIYCQDDNSHFFVYYSVETAKNKQPTTYKVTEFPSIKIHIEGGRVNGFFNNIGDALYAKDTRTDLEYTVMRATFPMYDLIGKYVILHFHLEDTPSQEGQANQKCLKSSLITNPTAGDDRVHDPVRIVQAWDNMCFAERILMGIMSDADIANAYNLGYYESIVGDNHTVTDGTSTYLTDPGFHYSDYFNNRMMGITQQGTLFMNATSWRTAYNVSTMDAILTLFPKGDIWGPAHEYGHMNQPPMNMAGTTEVSNNIFSNVAMFYAGLYSSRCEMPSAQLKNFQEGKTYLEAGTWGTTRMFWQLWCYYHATGHNKKFYPRLYQLLRNHPLTKTVKSAGIHDERYDMLHFAKMCCIAAEEDLTNFFTVWGFFVPLDHYTIDDYSVYDACLTQEDIDAVKAEIKAFNFPKNDAIILIDDRPGSTKTSYPSFPISQAGELGGLKDFDAASGAVPSGNYSFNLSVNTVTVETDGNKGVGYLIYDADGSLLGFYNTNTFDVRPEIVEKLRNGEAYVEVIGRDKDISLNVVNTILDGTPDKKRDLLSQLISKCEALLAQVDETGTKVGYLKQKPAKPLQTLTASAKELVDGMSDDGESLTSAYMKLSQSYEVLAVNENARIGIEPGATYLIANQGMANRVLSAKSDCNTSTNAAMPIMTSAPKTAEADPYAQQWLIDEADDGTCSLRNAATGRYAGIVAAYKANTILPTADDAHPYTLGKIAGKTGVFYFAPDNRPASSIHMNSGGNIYHYNTASEGTQWSITRVNTAEYMDLRNQISDLVEQTRELLDKAGDTYVADPEKVKLTASCFDGNSKQPSGNGAFTSWNTLIDDNPSTYFASNRQTGESTDGLDHYIKITAPDGVSLRHIQLVYTNNSFASNASYIHSYRLEASVDGESWAPVFEANEGLDIAFSAKNASDVVSVPDGTKQVRFVVTKSRESKAFHYTFLLSDIELRNTSEAVYTPSREYPEVKPADMKQADDAMTAADFAVKNPAMSLDDLQTHLSTLTDAYNNLTNKVDYWAGADKTVNDAEDAAAEFYLINGVKVDNPEHNVHIRRQGNRTTKEITL